MKQTLLLAFFFCAIHLEAQVSWQHMASLPGPGRHHAIAFSHGTKGYVVTGEGSSLMKDFWEYNSLTDTWTALPNYPGPARSFGCGFVIGDKAYIGFGHNTSSTYLTDWWQYDFNTSTWTQKNSFPGSGRDHPACAMMNGKIYVGFGDDNSGNYKDWWQYDPAGDSWVQKAQYPGASMHHPVTAQFNNLIYLSQGHLSGGGSVKFYSYNATNDTWTTLTNMPGPGVVAGASFYMGNNKVYSGCGITEPASVFHNEFYAYDITATTWSPIANYPGSGVFGPVSFVIGNAGYVVTGASTSGTNTKDLYKLSSPNALDAGIQSVTSPNGVSCSSTFSPTVLLQNFGTTTLTSCSINFHLDNNANQTQSWSGSLASGASAVITLPSITVTSGAHTYTCSTSSPNNSTDANPSNDQVQSSFNSAAPAALPLMEGFESSTTIPTGWTISNPDNDAAWQVSTTVAKTGSHCLGFNNCNGNGSTDMTGKKDKLSSTIYDFSTASTAQMSFDVAYALLVYQGTSYNDSLTVLASSNCGSTWSKIYAKGGSSLASGPQQTSVSSCWSPTTSDWRNDVINLNSFCGQSSVMFAFVNRSAWGEWIYLDNINITSTNTTTGISSLNSNQTVKIYPNPASTFVTIEGVFNSEKIHFNLFNILGDEIKSGDILTSGNNFTGTLQVSDIAHGMYFLRIIDGNNTFTRKINIE